MKKNMTAILWIIVGVLVLALPITRIYLPEQTWVTVALLVALAAVFALMIRENRKALTTRTAAFGFHSLLTSIFVIGIIGILNFLAARHPLKKDLTEKHIHTLSAQTEKVVRSLEKPLQATLYSQMGSSEKYRPLLENFDALSTQFKFEVVDPDKEPTRAKTSGIKSYNTLVLTYGDKTSKVEDPDEEKLTNAVIKITKEKKPILCNIVGHGERDFESQDEEGLKLAKKGLEDQSYQVKTVNLPQEAKIPPDCDAISILGPKSTIFEKEIQTISDFLEKGGRALFAISLDLQGAETAKELLGLLKKWHVQVSNTLIVDPVSRLLGVDPTTPIIASFSKNHSVTKEFQNNINCFFPLTRALEILPKAPPSLQLTWLSKTSPQSWSESGFNELKTGRVKFDENQDKKGPLITGVSVEGNLSGVIEKPSDSKSKDTKKTRMIIYGTPDFANNKYSRAGGNLDLFLNSVSWIMEDESLISIRSKKEDAGKIELTMQTGKMIFWLTVVIIPGLIAVSGITLWWRRKKL